MVSKTQKYIDFDISGLQDRYIGLHDGLRIESPLIKLLRNSWNVLLALPGEEELCVALEGGEGGGEEEAAAGLLEVVEHLDVVLQPEVDGCMTVDDQVKIPV